MQCGEILIPIGVQENAMQKREDVRYMVHYEGVGELNGEVSQGNSELPYLYGLTRLLIVGLRTNF